MNLDEVLTALRGLPAEKRASLEDEAMGKTSHMAWCPSPGPQAMAYFHPADILLYGGAGGGGKSDLGLGLAFTQHQRSLILRRRYSNLDALIDRAKEIASGTDYSFSGKPPPRLTTVDNRLIIFGANQYPGDEQGFQGQPFDLKVFDEASQFLESQVWFHIGWLRSTVIGVRTRAVLATNPPVSSDGDWLIKMFRPWLDITYSKPAEHGDLRWFVRDPDGNDMEVDGPEDVHLPGLIKPLKPLSRSFIPSRLADNPYLVHTDYGAKLDGLPEPLRSAVRDGNFGAAREDGEYQVIPSNWVLLAQQRWTEFPPTGVAMTAMGYDPAGGGSDAAVLAYRHGGWYGNLISVKGVETSDAPSMAAMVLKYRRDQAPIVIDLGGGYGGAIDLRFQDNGVTTLKFNGANTSTAKTVDGSLSFVNKRAEAWWKFREALDPSQDGGSTVALPPDPELRSDLTAASWTLGPRGIQIENKDDIRKRLGRSPDRGDAVVMAMSSGEIARKRMRNESLPTHSNVGYSSLKRRFR
jgi:hypothetical protein